MVKFTFLKLELILADQQADRHLLVESSSGGEWQFYISTITANTGRSLEDVPPSRVISW